MHDRDNISNETPIVDAVEQEQETTLEPDMPGPASPPVEADASDWQEQLHEVSVDDDRDEYRQ